MTSVERERDFKKDLLVASGLVVSGLLVCVMSLSQLAVDRSHAGSLTVPQLAQTTQPLQSTPGAEAKPSSPAEPDSSGSRPHEIAPEPARPDAEAQDAGSKPALPPAPAEKVGDPITKK